jgi:hypothetical protein
MGEEAMSLWLRREDPDGKTYFISSGKIVFFLLIIPTLGILIAMILPVVQSC